MVRLPRVLGFGREIESILLILSGHPEEIVKKISDKTSIGDYNLVGARTKLLSDTYFDTSSHFLSHHKLNLRLRMDNQDRWITMKTHPRRTLWGGMVRSELEVPWSPEIIEKVITELKIPQQPDSPSNQTVPTEPIELLKTKGLVPIQHRETQRQVRSITIGPDSSSALAELDVDSVLYDFDGQKIRLFEVEVESKSEKGQNVVKNVTKSLRGEYGPILRSWRHGKLATGTGIATLLKTGEMRSLVDTENRLLPAAFDKLNRIL
ncbi:MAG TPA: CYTH domain-containing protein [Candidatus Bathyarchaeia archaeon]|nr:CYTH domain-containing protein [Candidatus Bathyarchaeia archaeon]